MYRSFPYGPGLETMTPERFKSLFIEDEEMKFVTLWQGWCL